ncbi:MAG: hypothetical protein QOH26_1167 [Actinomycetota bacterium]|nr:hypothetical protein [Actinomycetota bacterium]
MSPNGLPEVYQVGGVDEDGHTWLPGHTEESDPFYSFGTVMRPYETGALFSFRAPAPDSYEGSFQFGGTSGATPLTAGWASKLIQEARTILDVRGSSGRFLARAHAGRRLPSRGPLADGDFTARELTDLLHHTARPAEPASALRYFLEGYGAVDEKTISSAMKVLRGDKAEPVRPQEDEAHRQAEAARGALFSSERCGMSPLAVGRSDE